MARNTRQGRPPVQYLDSPVAIIGAGIGGLTAALSPQLSGVRVRVFEQARASQWQAEGWSIPATVPEFLGLFSDFPAPVRDLIAAIPEPALFKRG
jgi:cation diffusion facilitator CzcD-associated flavoprotein CzcO